MAAVLVLLILTVLFGTQGFPCSVSVTGQPLWNTGNGLKLKIIIKNKGKPATTTTFMW